MLDIIKNFFALFLQLTAIQVLLLTSLPIRKVHLRLSTAVYVINVSVALRSKVYGGICEYLSSYFRKLNSKDETTIFGYRTPSRGLEVIKELAEWKPIEYQGPVFRLPSGDDDDERWETELIRMKLQFGIESVQIGSHLDYKEVEVGRNPLDQLVEVLRIKYGYEPEKVNLNGKLLEPCSRYHCYEANSDLLFSILEDLEKICPTDKERVKAFRSVSEASKHVNIIQLKNPYHESLHNIHLRITHMGRGTMKLIPEVVEKEGFKITNNSGQYVHLVLGELPSSSSRYCILETGIVPLSEDDIEIHSDMLNKLSPNIMKLILVISVLFSLGFSLIF